MTLCGAWRGGAAVTAHRPSEEAEGAPARGVSVGLGAKSAFPIEAAKTGSPGALANTETQPGRPEALGLFLPAREPALGRCRAGPGLTPGRWQAASHRRDSRKAEQGVTPDRGCEDKGQT